MPKRKGARKKTRTTTKGPTKTMQKNIAAIKRSIDAMKKKLSRV